MTHPIIFLCEFWITDSNGTQTFTKDVDCDSVLLDLNSLLYVYKLTLGHFLLSQQTIIPQQIDALT